MGNILEIENLKKYYGEVKAVDDISFSVKEGSLFAFLGLNGAGKSTTINILCSILNRDSGKITVDGKDFDSARDSIKKDTGIVFQTSVLDERLSVKENLTVRAAYYGFNREEIKKRVNTVTELLELGEIISRPYGKLSGGQKRRVDLARGIINTPRLLFLDEPTTGLDPKTRQKVWQVLTELRQKHSMTLFLTTHYMEEANRADDVVIMDNGKIAAHGTPLELKKKYSGDFVRLYVPQSEMTEKVIKKSGYAFSYANEGYNIKVEGSAQAKKFLFAAKDMLTDFEVVKGDMDDVFLSVTGKELKNE